MAQESAIRFPKGFMWGASTSAHQVEGGNRWNDWWRWEHRTGDPEPRLTSGDACRHYERYDADFALAAADGHNAHRLSIEWSRIEPAHHHFEAGAIAHYHEVFASLRRHGLTPIVTLLHFTLPTWVADRGGWAAAETIDDFAGFVRFCAREFGGEIDWWCTINEPEVLAFRGYSEGIWPPGTRDDSMALRVIANQLVAHGRAYRILHEEDRRDADGDGRAAHVGFAKHVVQLVPHRAWSPLDRLRAGFEDRVFNEAVIQAPITGRIALSIPGVRPVTLDVPELKGALDWIGLNYYTRWDVDALGKRPHVARRGAPVNDLGWEIWPHGLALAARRIAVAGVPILVTEHGVADAADALRPRALVESLLELGRAIEGGAPVIGYLHWSLMDNYEWEQGWRGRFGLYRVDVLRDPAGRERTKSAEVFARIARANAVAEGMAIEDGP